MDIRKFFGGGTPSSASSANSQQKKQQKVTEAFQKHGPGAAAKRKVLALAVVRIR
jgi:hypothetical protein